MTKFELAEFTENENGTRLTTEIFNREVIITIDEGPCHYELNEDGGVDTNIEVFNSTNFSFDISDFDITELEKFVKEFKNGKTI